MRRRFVTLDVFTARRFAGNPLAVVLDCEGLDQATMQTIAREFNFPETVFVLTAPLPVSRAEIRIFTPASELAFAGHPTVGTAVLLGRGEAGGGPRDIVLAEGIGPVRCKVEPLGRDHGRAQFEVPRLPADAGAVPDRTTIATALHLDESDIGFDRFEPNRWSAGTAFVFVPVRGIDAIRRCRPDSARFDAAFGQSGPGLAYVFCRETVDPRHAFHARMFAPSLGIPEDPATGSAAAAFAGIVARHGGLADGNHRFIIEQGYEMGRPSVIRLAIVMAAQKLASASIGGEAVVVTEGTIEA